MGLAAFHASRALSTKRNDDPEHASRPFDLERDGFVLAEGSATLILEDLEFARERGAPILCEAVSYGQSADAFHVTQPSENGEGAARAMNIALRKGWDRGQRRRLHQRAWHEHAAQRQVRDDVDQDRLRRVGTCDSDQLQQVDARPHPRRGGRHRVRGDRALDPRSEDPHDPQHRGPRPRLRPRLHARGARARSTSSTR